MASPLVDEGPWSHGRVPRPDGECNVVQSMWNYLWLLRIGGEGAFGDHGAGLFQRRPGPVSRDFKTHVYFHRPTVSARSLPGAEKKMNSRFNFRPFAPPKCCTYSFAAHSAHYVMHMWMATYDNGLAWTLYGPCAVNALSRQWTFR